MKNSAAIIPFACALFVTGCTHMMTFTPPSIPSCPSAGANKGTAVISQVADARPAGTDIFVFSNPPHKWVYQCAEKPEDIVHKLMTEALQRRGITESANAAEARRVNVEILEFSGHNDPGVWYVGKCFYNISCVIKTEGPNGGKSFTATGSGTNFIMRLSDENINELLTQTYDDFLHNLDRKLGEAGY